MKKFILLAYIFCISSTKILAQNIEVQQIRTHISYLASDDLKGRATDTKGAKKAAKYIKNQFKKIGLLPKGTDGYYHNYVYRNGSNPHGEDMKAKPHTGTNVVGYIDNGAEETVVIGAHYDHLGEGHDGNSLDPNPADKIHNGADDNASGVAGVIELARLYQNNRVREPYNFVFICFSGEELGLFGSKKYCETPTIDLKKVHFMLNMDMIGRLNAEKSILIGGVGTAPELFDIIGIVQKNGIKVKVDSAGIGPSDHTSFYLKDIPVLFVFTGQHSDYHKPSDDTEKINFEGEIQVLELVTKIIDGCMMFPKFKFTPTKSKQSDTPNFKVTLGIMPDYTYDGRGLRVDGVTDGKPASKAGLKAGDVILQLGTVEVMSIQEYMQGLAMFKKGDTTTVKVKRLNEELMFNVTF